MKKIFLIVFLHVLAEHSLSQDVNWKKVNVDEFLTVSLPEHFNSSDTFIIKKGKKYDVKLFKAILRSTTLGITVTQVDFNFNPYDFKSFKEAFEGVKYGFRKNAESKGYAIDIKDTSVNDVPGFKAEVFSDNSKTVVSRVCYVFCVNTVNYLFVGVPIGNSIVENEKELGSLVKSIRFHKEKILARASDDEISSSPFENGQKVGEIAGILLIVAVIIYSIYKFNSKQKRKTYIL